MFHNRKSLFVLLCMAVATITSLAAKADDAPQAFLILPSTAASAMNSLENASHHNLQSSPQSVSESFRQGIQHYNAGDKAGAVNALEYAALQGHTVSLWKLGRMFAEGDGVDLDDLRAFEYFSQIADRYADESPDSKQAPFVSSAFVALGEYFLEGIPGSYVKPDINRAVDMFQYAASYYGDPDGQFSLARLYLKGNGVPKDARQAARWLKLAACKGHYQAQALLGNLLISGEGVPKQPSLGLMWLTLARDATLANGEDAWIAELHDKNFAIASETEREQAEAFLEEHHRQKQ